MFINGCETCQLKPEEALPFVAAFGRAGASGILGTEVSINLPLAAEVGESILQGIAGGLPAGQVLRETRWKLLPAGDSFVIRAYERAHRSSSRMLMDGSCASGGGQFCRSIA